MEFDKDDYILGVWFANADDNNSNFMLTVKRKLGEVDQWEGEYRTRYFKDNKTFNSEDIKNFRAFKTKGSISEDRIEKKMHDLFDFVKIKYNKDREYVEIKGGMDKFVFKLAQCEWSHIKKFNSEENLKEFMENKEN